MATIRETNNKLLAARNPDGSAKYTTQQVINAFTKKYGIGFGDVTAKTDVGVLNKALELSKKAGGSVIAYLPQEFLAKKHRQPTKPTPPPEQEAVSLPGDNQPEGVPSENELSGKVKRIGGPGDIGSNIKRAMGAAEKLRLEVRASLPNPTPEMAKVLGSKEQVEIDKIRKTRAKKTAKAKQAAEVEREGMLKKGLAERVATDAMQVLISFPKMLTSAIGSFEVKKGESPYESGFKAAGELVPATIGGLAAWKDNPLKAAKARPFSTMLDIYPMLKGLSNAARVSKHALEVGSASRKAARKAEFVASGKYRKPSPVELIDRNINEAGKVLNVGKNVVKGDVAAVSRAVATDAAKSAKAVGNAISKAFKAIPEGRFTTMLDDAYKRRPKFIKKVIDYSKGEPARLRQQILDLYNAGNADATEFLEMALREPLDVESAVLQAGNTVPKTAASIVKKARKARREGVEIPRVTPAEVALALEYDPNGPIARKSNVLGRVKQELDALREAKAALSTAEGPELKAAREAVRDRRDDLALKVIDATDQAIQAKESDIANIRNRAASTEAERSTNFANREEVLARNNAERAAEAKARAEATRAGVEASRGRRVAEAAEAGDARIARAKERETARASNAEQSAERKAAASDRLKRLRDDVDAATARVDELEEHAIQSRADLRHLTDPSLGKPAPKPWLDEAEANVANASKALEAAKVSRKHLLEDIQAAERAAGRTVSASERATELASSAARAKRIAESSKAAAIEKAASTGNSVLERLRARAVAIEDIVAAGNARRAEREARFAKGSAARASATEEAVARATKRGDARIERAANSGERFASTPVELVSPEMVTDRAATQRELGRATEEARNVAEVDVEARGGKLPTESVSILEERATPHDVRQAAKANVVELASTAKAAATYGVTARRAQDDLAKFESIISGQGGPAPLVVKVTPEVERKLNRLRAEIRDVETGALTIPSEHTTLKDMLSEVESHRSAKFSPDQRKLVDPTYGYREITVKNPSTGKSERFLADPRIAYAYELTDGAEHAKRLFGDTARLITQTVKQVKLPLSIKTILGNILGNEFLMSVVNGTPFQMGSAAKEFAKYSAYMRKAGKNRIPDRFYDAINRTNLMSVNAFEQDIKAMRGVPGITHAANIGGKAMEVGDTAYKLPVARKRFEDNVRFLADLRDGEYLELQITPRTKMRLTKKGDNFVATTKGGRRKVLKSEYALDKFLGQDASTAAKAYTFDYSDIPGWVHWIRTAGGIGAGSPFFTWAFKALSVPFVKDGLLESVMGGVGANIRTNSPRAAARMLAQDFATSMRRATLLGMINRESEDEAMLRKATSYIPGDASATVIKASSDPGSLAMGRFSSANWLEPTLGVLSVTRYLADRILNGDLEEQLTSGVDMSPIPKGATEAEVKVRNKRDEAIMRRNVRRALKLARSPNPVAKTLATIGLSGGILFDMYNGFLESEKAGKDMTILEGMERAFVPTSIKGIWLAYKAYLTDDKMTDRASPDPGVQMESKANFMFNQLIGMGWKHTSTKRAKDRYLNAVTKELNAQLDMWLLKRNQKRRTSMGRATEESGATRSRGDELMDAEYKRDKAQVKKLKRILGEVKKQASKDWDNAHDRLIRKARR